MKFKIDENLPVEFADLLRAAQYDAVMVKEQGLVGIGDPRLAEVCAAEGRALVTLDVGFADIRSFPPQQSPGFLVFRVHRQDKPYLLAIFERTLPLLEQEPVMGRPWIIEETRVRIRGGAD